MISALHELSLILVSLSLVAFGGGNVIIPDLQAQVVAVHGWMTAREFIDIFAISRAAPGPSMLMVLPIGYRVAGGLGACAAVICLFLPACLIMFFCPAMVDRWKTNPWIQTILQALAPVTMGLVLASAFILGETAATGWLTVLIIFASLILLAYTRTSVLLLIGLSGLLGFLFLQGPAA
jgi:chromate transporter